MKLSLVFFSILNLSNLNLLSDFSYSIFSSHSKHKLGQARIMGKHGTPFFVDSRTEVIDFDSGKLRLSVDLSSFVEFQNLHYKWIIPENVEMTWGLPDGVINELSGNNPARLDLEVKNLNMNVNQNIILYVERTEGENILGSSFVIASRKELTEEYQKMPEDNDDEAQFKATAFDENTVPKKKFIY
jgi:hypothetical protein